MTMLELLRDLEVKAEAFKNAQNTASYARMEETEALNKLNAAQRAFDEAVAELKKDSDPKTDWGKK